MKKKINPFYIGFSKGYKKGLECGRKKALIELEKVYENNKTVRKL